jgi:hypothetical protein
LTIPRLKNDGWRLILPLDGAQGSQRELPGITVCRHDRDVGLVDLARRGAGAILEQGASNNSAAQCHAPATRPRVPCCGTEQLGGEGVESPAELCEDEPAEGQQSISMR